LYGYHYDEVNLPPPGAVDPSFELLEYDFTSGKCRKPMATSLGVHYLGAACPLPDISHAPSGLMGVTKPIACKMPDPDLELFTEYLNFCIKIIHEEFQHCILPSDADISVETWLKGAPYTQKRKAMLQRISEMRAQSRNGDLFVKSFIKHEHYLMYKHFRGIYSRSDYFKTEMGPICALIGDKMFDHPAFIKKIPVSQRPQAIIDRFSVPGVKVAANDFTAYESMFKRLQMTIEIFFFAFCTQNLSGYNYYNKLMQRIKMGKNILVFTKWMARLIAKRYSGEMDTSSMNGLFNYLIIRFLNYKSGETHSILPFLEGDDSLNPFFGKLDETILVRLGARAKLEYFDDVFSASFCGMVFSENSCQIVTDPIKAILNFGYSNNFYLKSNKHKLNCLLRAKSMSMLHTFPGCPILSNLAGYGMRVSGLCSDRDMVKYFCRSDPYLLVKFKDVLAHPVVRQTPTLDTRILFEKLYSISVAEQLIIERYFDELQTQQVISHPMIDAHLHPDQIDYYERYHHSLPVDDYYFL